MNILDLSKHKGQVYNRICRVGVELEGAWLKLPANANFEHDGSVKGFGEQAGRDREITTDGKTLFVGEIPSPPLMPRAIKKWMETYYPPYVNKTCGLHVHMSFPTGLHYQRLMCREYHDTMIEYLKLWAKAEAFDKDHHIWRRLAGEFEHCQLKYWPDKQVRVDRKNFNRDFEGHRYTAVNYCHGLRGKQTLEIRVLPMMQDVAQAYRAVMEVLDITNAAMVALAKPERAIVGDFKMGGTLHPVVEEAIEVI